MIDNNKIISLFNVNTIKSQIHFNRYLKLINYADQYPCINHLEKHHIIPKSMEGSDDLDNIILLSKRQHYLAHFLLWKAFRNRSMTRAFNFMSLRTKKINSKKYAGVKEGMTLSLGGFVELSCCELNVGIED